MFLVLKQFYRFSKHDQIGEIRIPMCQIDLAVPIEGWKDLDPPVDEDSVSLKFLS